MLPFSAFSSDKFLVSDNKIIFDTFAAENERDQEITWDDVDTFEQLLKENKTITLLELNSSGGDVAAAFYIADLVIDYELDTNVNGTCDSACTTIFLGGETRTIERGSWLGFHQSYWDSGDIEEYYRSNKGAYDWDTKFEFASWLYEDTQQEILRNLEYLIERGVDAGFAIKTMQATSSDMWYPRRKQLLEAGVIVN